MPLFGAAYAAPNKGTQIKAPQFYTNFPKLISLYPRYVVYRGYIVFAFSVIMFVCLSVCLFVCKLFFVKDFSATTWVRFLKFGTKLDSDELCNKRTATYCLSVPLFVHFSFSPMEISVTDFSAPIRASVFKFCVHLHESKVYCVNSN